MRNNQPITGKSVQLTPGVAYITQTNTAGIITYANDDFCKASGYIDSELIGQNHNLIRHPDMPEACFADLWQSLKNGTPWDGLMKNRCKNGDHYWVHAFVSPIEDHGVITGFTSARTAATAEEIAKVEPIYRSLQAGETTYTIKNGKLRRRNIFSFFNPIRRIKESSVSQQITLLIAAVVIGIALIGTLSQAILNEVKVNGPIYSKVVDDKDLIADILPPPEYLIESWLTALEMARAKPAELPAFEKKMQTLTSDYQTRHQYWVDKMPAGALREAMLTESYQPALTFMKIRDDEFIPAVKAGDTDKTNAALEKMKAAYLQHRAAVDKTVSIATTQIATNEELARTTISKSTITLIIATTLIGLMIVGFGVFLVKMIRTLLGGDPRYAREIVRHIAAGNLRVPVKLSNTENSSLLNSLKGMQSKLHEAVGGIQSGAVTVASTAEQVAQSAAHVKNFTDAQSAISAAVASNIEQMSASVGNVAQNANSAHEQAVSSGQICEAGAVVVEQSVASMQNIANVVSDTVTSVRSIEARSKQIEAIVSTIKEIADQTNLLALNAAIEAARAGESGRGFSVVADEVRNLAERTGQATKEISLTVDTIRVDMSSLVHSMESVNETAMSGATLANEAGDAIQKINRSSRQVVEMVDSITRAVLEQERAVSDISQHIEKITQLAEENDQTAKESSQAAEHLHGAAHDLSMAVQRFAA
ncbi:methyl-accepting chemotaxis protein [Leeia sp. TBRC 13508]|uniref:Methyl-accepting chemotaxis protein n=1 Tax=Leeia speluncae TaxID=2884804 RepID=A0ABS8D590_9NEIS|nr:PAS domain-containing methyl-accepting chemotaxis protein [Leeia speluncae]MCB6183360.1 methyl-accepting chemotaxis protein [Leeia speluncae]